MQISFAVFRCAIKNWITLRILDALYIVKGNSILTDW